MQIVHDYPPLYDEIAARFPVVGKGVIYAWGPTIYNPERVFIPPYLIAHEEVHSERQGSDIRGWWRRYIDDPAFRLAEEIPAHRVEYRFRMAAARNRHERRSALKEVAGRLSGPLYGRSIAPGAARAAVAG